MMIVWSPEGRTPPVKTYHNPLDAESAAQGMAQRHVGQTFHVMVSTAAYKVDKEVCCIVKDCTNHKSNGLFIGEMCACCHAFIVKGKGRDSQAYRNALKAAKELLT